VYLGKKNPLFYLLFPIALQQGPAAFINQDFSLAGKKIFSVNENIFIDVLFFIVLLISVSLIKARVPKLGSIGPKLLIFYLIYITTLFLVDFLTYKDANEVLLTGRNFFYIPVAFFLWLAIFHSVERRDYEEFLKLLFFITPISAILYILNSSNTLSIFPKELVYSEVETDSAYFFRDFSTIPLFLIPVLVMTTQSLLMPIFKVPKGLLLINIIVLPMALMFTFTRSLIITVVLQLVIMLILNGLKKGVKGIKQFVVFVLLFAIFLIPVFLVAKKTFPNQVVYLTSRFTNVSSEGVKEQNVNIRVEYLKAAIQITNYTSPLYGAGMTKEFYPQLNSIGAWMADSTLPNLLYHTGWLGVAFIYITLIFFSFDTVIFYFKTGDWLAAYLASSFITLIISSLIMGGQELHGSVWSFMNLALYTVIKFNLWKKKIFFISTDLKKVVIQAS
jgi:hypothetical protein